jgi:putative hydrolase of the HAD superfamily
VTSAVLFDFGGTLDAVGVPWRDRVFRYFREAGSSVSREAFDPVFFRVDDALVGRVSSTSSFAETVSRLVTGVAAELDGADRHRAGRVAGRFLDEACATFREHRPVLERLARRYRLGIISNFYGNLAAVCGDVGLGALFATVVDSTRFGASKPAPAIFRHALTGLEVEAARAVYVGDSVSRDMIGARGVGMPHVWLAPSSPRDSRPCCPDDTVIHRLAELEELLR